LLNNFEQFSVAEASQPIADARDLDELARLAVEQLCQVLHCDVAFLLKQPMPGEAICWSTSPTALPAMTIPGVPARLDGSSLAGRALKKGETLFFTEPEAGSNVPARERAMVAVPLKTPNAVLGVIQLSGAVQNLTDTATLAAVESLAAKFAEAVAKLRGQATEGPGARVSPPSLNREANARLNLEHVYKSSYYGARDLLSCDAFFILLYDEENHAAEFVLRIDKGVAMPAERVALGDSLIDYVLRTRRAAVVDDTELETRFKIRRLGSPQAVRSLICVPMDIGGKTIGALSAQSYRPNAYTEAEVKVLTVFAEQTALAIHSARLFAESQRKVEQLAVLNEVTRIVSSTIEIGRLLDLIFEEVRRILPADTYYIALADEEKQELKIEAMVDDGERFPSTVVPLGNSLASYVIRHRVPLLLRNVREQAPSLGVGSSRLGKPKS
jgi:GAF domain-containing protein